MATPSQKPFDWLLGPSLTATREKTVAMIFGRWRKKPQVRQDETYYLSSRNMRVSGEMSLGYRELFVFLNDDQALLLGLVPADQYNKEAL